MNHLQLADVFLKYINATFPDVTTIEQLAEKRGWSEDDYEYYKETYANSGANLLAKWQNAVSISPTTAGYQLTIVYNTNQMVTLCLDKTPACCGMAFIHSFIIKSTIREQDLKYFMDTLLAWAKKNISGANSRFIVNMVETRRTPAGDGFLDPMEELTTIDDPQIQYKPLWNYLHTNAQAVRTSLMPNRNTGNIIHHMECIFA